MDIYINKAHRTTAGQKGRFTSGFLIHHFSKMMNIKQEIRFPSKWWQIQHHSH